MQSMKFEKWIKIRIGEPITALDCDYNNVIFGAISGYVGFYSVDNQELKYIPDVFEELIRSVRIEGNTTYIVVGDWQCLIMDTKTKEFRQLKFDRRPHNPQICCSSLALYDSGKVLLLAVAPTQNKDIGIDITTKKNSVYVQNVKTGEMNPYFIEMPQLGVPFDFDGDRVLILEYLKDSKKKISCVHFNTEPPSITTIIEVSSSIEFISHGKLLSQGYLYVENHRRVVHYDKNIVEIFRAKSQIMAMDYQSDLLTIVDYDSNVSVLKGFKLILSFNILKLQLIPPELIKHKYLFDMGYPYYVRNNGQKLAVSTDLGLLVISLVL